MEHEFEEYDYVFIPSPDGSDEKVSGTIQKIDGDFAVVELPDGEEIYCRIEDMEFIPPIVLSKDDLSAIIRFEKSSNDLKSLDDYPGEIIADEEYSVTLDDFQVAFNNIIKDQSTYNDVYAWLDLIYYILDDYYDCSFRGAIEDKQYFKYPETEELMLSWIVISLRDYYFSFDGDDENPQNLDFNRIVNDIDNFKSGRKVFPWLWSGIQEHSFIFKVHEKEMKKFDEDMLQMTRDILEKKAAEGYPFAIEKMGYSYYGGGPLYECDWVKSRDCFLRLMDMDNVDDSDKCDYANTLGYIYYYGRCNNMVPEYEPALKYFTIGALGGNHESIYKLADMYLNGYGTTKNTYIATELIYKVYEKAFEQFCIGNDSSKLADCALRLGTYYRKGLLADDTDSEERNMRIAYYYYTVADFAIRRKKKKDYYGDNNVFISIQKELEKMYERYPLDDTTVFKEDEPFLLQQIFHDGYSCKVTFEAKDGDLEIKAERIKKPNLRLVEMMIICHPDQRTCELTKAVTETAEKVKDYNIINYQKSFIADNVRYDSKEQLLTFTHHGDKVATVHSDSFFHRIVPAKEPGKRNHKFVNVLFDNSEVEYTYLCGDLKLEKGDKVIVEARGVEQEVTVVSVFSKPISDMPLSLNAYKKILRKA
jgi:hypothetical protein